MIIYYDFMVSQKTLDPDNPRGVIDSLLLEVAKIKDETGHEGDDVINLNTITALISEAFGAGKLETGKNEIFPIK